MQPALRGCRPFARRPNDGNGNAQTTHRRRGSFQYVSSQPWHKTPCDKLPHSAH
jgi:hypothetical protein